MLQAPKPSEETPERQLLEASNVKVILRQDSNLHSMNLLKKANTCQYKPVEICACEFRCMCACLVNRTPDTSFARF